MISIDKQIEVLHDHYNKSFELIREREKQRDFLFLLLIGLYTVLLIEVKYPANFGDALGKLSLQIGDFQLGMLPLAALLSVSWIFTFTVALRYCQATVAVEVQYRYLHLLEGKISKLFNDENLYQREGKAYLEDYPLYREWVWFVYVILFPIILCLGTAIIITTEWQGLQTSFWYKLFDTLIAVGLLISVLVYRIPVQIASRIKTKFKRNN